MGKLSELIGVLKDARDAASEVSAAINDTRSTSIAKLSSTATLQFPVIISKSINIDTASNMVKALERQYATFVQIVISLQPTLDLEKDKNIAGYIKKFHQNGITPMDLMESCTNVYSNEAYGLYLMMSINNGSNGIVVKSNKDQLFNIEEQLNPAKLNDLYKPKQITLAVAESSLDYYCKKNNIVTEANVHHRDIDAINDGEQNADIKLRKTMAKHQLNQDGRTNKFREDQFIHQKQMDAAKLQNDIAKAEAEYRSKAIVKLSDNDVKKANELVPTTLSVALHQVKGDNFGGVVNFVLGVKGLMHPVNSSDMINNLLDGYKDGNKFFNFLRWTSGEISFIKDFLFNVDGIKEDVIRKHEKGGSHWWTTLKRRKTAAKLKNALGKNKILPNATIVCSMEEIMEIKDVYGVDLMEPKNVLRLMERYYLLGFAVVDESQELAYFIFDGERSYQTLSFKGLERENNNKNDFKDIYKMINSGRL